MIICGGVFDAGSKGGLQIQLGLNIFNAFFNFQIPSNTVIIYL